MGDGFPRERVELSTTAGAATTRRIPPVSETVSNLSGEVDRLGVLLSELHSRLAPVMLPSYPQDAVKAQNVESVPAKCPLEEELISIRRKAESLSRVLIDLDERLRL